MAFLRHHISDPGHPVLEAERRLVEMARSKLLEHLLSSRGDDGLLSDRESVEAEVRAATVEQVRGLTSDLELREELTRELSEETLEHLFFPRGG